MRGTTMERVHESLPQSRTLATTAHRSVHRRDRAEESHMLNTTHRSTVQPRLEVLEDRTVPTVTFHGGPVLQIPEAQPYFYGPNWNTDPTLISQRTALISYEKYLVVSPFITLLNQAGYGISPGTPVD